MTGRNPVQPCRGKREDNLSYNMGDMLDLLLIWLGKHLLFYHYQQTIHAGSCCGALGPARLCLSLPSRASWGSSLVCTDSQTMLGNQPFGKPLAGLGQTREWLFYLVTIMDAEFLHLCPSVVNFLVSTMANEKEVHVSQRI